MFPSANIDGLGKTNLTVFFFSFFFFFFFFCDISTAENISGPVLLEQYVAIADYKKQNRNEVNMVAGDIVEVIDKNENGKFSLHSTWGLSERENKWQFSPKLSQILSRSFVLFHNSFCRKAKFPTEDLF